MRGFAPLRRSNCCKKAGARSSYRCVHESGLSGYDVTSRWGFFAPAATPKAIVDRLNAEIRKLLLTADMKERILKGGAEPFVTTPDEFRRLFLSEVERWAALVRHAKIKLE